MSVDISVRLQPRASKDAIGDFRDGVLTVRVTAPPVGGRANEAMCRLLARRLSIARSRVTIVRGERSRTKLIRLADVDLDSALEALR